MFNHNNNFVYPCYCARLYKMLTSDFGNYSESDSTVTSSTESFNLNSESSDYPGSEIDHLDNNSGRKQSHTKSKSRSRSQKKVKYWTLPTMSNGTFNPSMLTARQQLQYLSQKSKLGEESDSLEMSPLRLDRIKFEEMKSLTGNSGKEHENSATSPKTANSSTGSPSSPSNRSTSSKVGTTAAARGSKLKEEVSGSPTIKEPSKAKKIARSKSIEPKEQKSSKKLKTDSIVQYVDSQASSVVTTSNDDSITATENVTDRVTNDHNDEHSNDTELSINNNHINPYENINNNNHVTDNENITINNQVTDNNRIANDNCTINNEKITDSSSNSFFGNVKSFLFDYKAHHVKHFENFLKDFAKRLGLTPEDEIVKKKREEIMRKGMI